MKRFDKTISLCLIDIFVSLAQTSLVLPKDTWNIDRVWLAVASSECLWFAAVAGAFVAAFTDMILLWMFGSPLRTGYQDNRKEEASLTTV